MFRVVGSILVFAVCAQVSFAQAPSRKNIYASILQDARNEPTPDGTFGYLYKTEDGITSSARGGPNGVIQGGFSYTDPTGLKVNINYNAGSRTRPSAVEPSQKQQSAPKYYDNQSGSRSAPVYRNQPQYYEQPSQGYQEYQEPQYQQPQTRYRPRQPAYIRPQRIEEVYQQRRNRPINNEIYDDYNYSY
ncbi:uncharacterized protein [Diabrotica undecimpunctata]|uniref:uncharacterized protein n=1 Tax=Diabrotica undecimpunctata TaxID=50387 RepID=UPI003B6322B7